MRKGARDGSLNLHIRLATKGDLDALLNLENICFKEETFQKRQLKYLLLKARSMVLAAEIDRNIIGSMIILLRKNILNARIYSFNVHPEHRRKGIGSSLMDTALDKLEKKDIRISHLRWGSIIQLPGTYTGQRVLLLIKNYQITIRTVMMLCILLKN